MDTRQNSYIDQAAKEIYSDTDIDKLFKKINTMDSRNNRAIGSDSEESVAQKVTTRSSAKEAISRDTDRKTPR